MPRFDAFTGGFNSLPNHFNPSIQSELTINWIPERTGSPVQGVGDDVTDKNIRCSLIRTPGLQTFCTLPKSPVRCVLAGEYRLFAAAGDSWYEIFSNGTFTDRSVPGFGGPHPASGIGPAGGHIGNNFEPVQAFTNGNQVLIISAGMAYCDNGNGPVPCQYSIPLSDLVVDPSDISGHTLTTAAGNYFDQSDVGRTVQITDGAGFNVGLIQPINSVDSQGRAIGTTNWGIPGSSLGKGIEWIGNITFTDLELSVGINALTSPTIKFGPSDIGATVQITGGTGGTWYPGTYHIIGLVYDSAGVPTGTAIIDAPAGTLGATGGTGTEESMFVTAAQGAFLDGYYFALPYPQTNHVQFSAIGDGTSWNPLDYFVKTYQSDNVGALFSDHEELYTFGDIESTQVWRDVGNADNPFASDPGSVMHVGAQAQWSVVRLGQGVAWIGQDMRRGTRRAYYAVGYNAQAVSTAAIEKEWNSYTTIWDAVAYTMAFEGHEIWVISFPTANQTWCYDFATGFWFQWSWCGVPGWNRIRPWVHCVVALGGANNTEQHYGGDWQTGQIYVISRNFKTDDGTIITRTRRAPEVTKENMRRFYARFELDCDVLGLQRIFWNRLGNGRDRIWQIETSQSSESGPTTVVLRWSDDRMQSLQTVFAQSIDATVDVALSNAYLKYTDATWN